MTETTPAGSQQSDESLGALFASASRDLSALVKGEIELAKSELAAGAKKGATAGAMFGTAGFLGLLALILLLISAAYGLVAAGLDPSIAFLIVAGVLLLLAGVLAFVGKRAVGSLGPPERTIRTTKDTAAFLKSPRSGDAPSPSS
jgi:Putative Actinobacterial Holin-X, holin superfamily III